MDKETLPKKCASASGGAPVEPKYLAVACDAAHAGKIKADLTPILMGCPRVFQLLDTWQSRSDYLIVLVRMNTASVMAFAADGVYNLSRQTVRAVKTCKGKRCVWFFGLDAAALATVREALDGVAARSWKPTLADIPEQGTA